MPLLSPPHVPIIVAVSDRVIGATTVKQKAFFEKLTHYQNPESQETFVVVDVLVRLYAATESGGYGEELTGPGFVAYPVQLVADNRSAVDLATGLIVANRGNESNQEWRDFLDTFEQPLMRQGDYFEYAREHETLLIGDLIRDHIEQADAAPFHRFC